jgi:hypothetical protein
LGTFVTNENTRHVEAPYKLGANTYIFGATNGGWFKMASVDATGKFIECRHAAPNLLSDIDALTPAIWADANRGGAYSVTDVVTGDCTGTLR